MKVVAVSICVMWGLCIRLGTVLILVSASQVKADFVSYSQWEALSDNDRSSYIAGMFDGLTTIRNPDPRYNLHYFSCVAKSAMDSGQLADQVRAYGSRHSQLHAGSVSTVLINYLLELCGKLP